MRITPLQSHQFRREKKKRKIVVGICCTQQVGKGGWRGSKKTGHTEVPCSKQVLLAFPIGGQLPADRAVAGGFVCLR